MCLINRYHDHQLKINQVPLKVKIHKKYAKFINFNLVKLKKLRHLIIAFKVKKGLVHNGAAMKVIIGVKVKWTIWIIQSSKKKILNLTPSFVFQSLKFKMQTPGFWSKIKSFPLQATIPEFKIFTRQNKFQIRMETYGRDRWRQELGCTTTLFQRTKFRLTALLLIQLGLLKRLSSIRGASPLRIIRLICHRARAFKFSIRNGSQMGESSPPVITKHNKI